MTDQHHQMETVNVSMMDHHYHRHQQHQQKKWANKLNQTTATVVDLNLSDHNNKNNNSNKSLVYQSRRSNRGGRPGGQIRLGISTYSSSCQRLNCTNTLPHLQLSATDHLFNELWVDGPKCNQQQQLKKQQRCNSTNINNNEENEIWIDGPKNALVAVEKQKKSTAANTTTISSAAACKLVTSAKHILNQSVNKSCQQQTKNNSTTTTTTTALKSNSIDSLEGFDRDLLKQLNEQDTNILFDASLKFDPNSRPISLLSNHSTDNLLNQQNRLIQDANQKCQHRLHQNLANLDIMDIIDPKKQQYLQQQQANNEKYSSASSSIASKSTTSFPDSLNEFLTAESNLTEIDSVNQTQIRKLKELKDIYDQMIFKRSCEQMESLHKKLESLLKVNLTNIPTTITTATEKTKTAAAAVAELNYSVPLISSRKESSSSPTSSSPVSSSSSSSSQIKSLENSNTVEKTYSPEQQNPYSVPFDHLLNHQPINSSSSIDGNNNNSLYSNNNNKSKSSPIQQPHLPLESSHKHRLFFNFNHHSSKYQPNFFVASSSVTSAASTINEPKLNAVAIESADLSSSTSTSASASVSTATSTSISSKKKHSFSLSVPSTPKCVSKNSSKKQHQQTTTTTSKQHHAYPPVLKILKQTANLLTSSLNSSIQNNKAFVCGVSSTKISTTAATTTKSAESAESAELPVKDHHHHRSILERLFNRSKSSNNNQKNATKQQPVVSLSDAMNNHLKKTVELLHQQQQPLSSKSSKTTSRSSDNGSMLSTCSSSHENTEIWNCTATAATSGNKTVTNLSFMNSKSSGYDSN